MRNLPLSGSEIGDDESTDEHLSETVGELTKVDFVGGTQCKSRLEWVDLAGMNVPCEKYESPKDAIRQGLRRGTCELYHSSCAERMNELEPSHRFRCCRLTLRMPRKRGVGLSPFVQRTEIVEGFLVADASSADANLSPFPEGGERQAKFALKSKEGEFYIVNLPAADAPWMVPDESIFNGDIPTAMAAQEVAYSGVLTTVFFKVFHHFLGGTGTLDEFVAPEGESDEGKERVEELRNCGGLGKVCESFWPPGEKSDENKVSEAEEHAEDKVGEESEENEEEEADVIDLVAACPVLYFRAWNDAKKFALRVKQRAKQLCQGRVWLSKLLAEMVNPDPETRKLPSELLTPDYVPDPELKDELAHVTMTAFTSPVSVETHTAVVKKAKSLLSPSDPLRQTYVQHLLIREAERSFATSQLLAPEMSSGADSNLLLPTSAAASRSSGNKRDSVTAGRVPGASPPPKLQKNAVLGGGSSSSSEGEAVEGPQLKFLKNTEFFLDEGGNLWAPLLKFEQVDEKAHKSLVKLRKGVEHTASCTIFQCLIGHLLCAKP